MWGAEVRERAKGLLGGRRGRRYPWGVSRHGFLDHELPLAIAHRGGGEEAPENTVAAFEAAVRMGYTHLETDAHLTADGVLVAFHDEHLDRVTDGQGAVADLPWSEVQQARIGGTEPVPTIDELFERFPDTFFNLDPKVDHAVVALAAAIRRHRAEDRVCIGAFSDRRLRRMRALFGGRICTAAAPKEIAGVLGALRLRRSPGGGGWACMQVPLRHRGIEILTPALVRTVHALGRQVHVWTIDEPDEMHRLLDMGVDGIMTDRPSVLRAVIAERGAAG